MAFQAYSFSFNGISSEEFGLIKYNLDNNKNPDNVNLVAPITVYEEKLPRRSSTLYMGSAQNEQQEMTFVVGIAPELLGQHRYFDRYEISSIVDWLTGEEGYKWLSIQQPDMEHIRYRCRCTNIKQISIGWLPLAFEVKFLCDSSHGYRYPEEYTYEVETNKSIVLFNKSNIIYPYKPKIEITLSSGFGTISIKNITDNNRDMKFTSVPNTTGMKILIDNENEIITKDGDAGANLYQYFNFKYFRLKKGENQILINGKSVVKFICEFPINIGG